ncbi:hypothetical protein DV738_g1692, partial [Chaetothyriales sp. CBS 135597]
MARQPSAIVIARHGARIDQADRSWRKKNAAIAYDPPLTYGGWIQCQMLGSRIAVELDALETSPKSGSLNEDELKNPRPRKRRRIIIHSSPYLRCVQTAVAIAAGLNQAQTSQRPRQKTGRTSLSRPRVAHASPAIPEEDTEVPRSVPDRRDGSPPGLPSDRPELRLDSFLGEWLSPDYFETHMRPPPSEELVQRAKEYLHQPAEKIYGADMASPLVPDIGSVDWSEKEKELAAAPLHDKIGLRAMALKHSRHFSFETGTRGRLAGFNRIGKLASTAYHPPVPTYAIATHDPIPIGFVAHARDACVDIDYDWDSQQPPLLWGNGGPFNEEWAGMHHRFRNGLEKMLLYYNSNDSDDDEEDIVVVLVTHQAGCNALLRLMTGAPALHDVGTSSLTLATRKPASEGMSPIRRTASCRRGSLDLGIADEYEMKIIASTEHLRGGSNPLGLNSPRLAASPAFASKRVVGPDSPDGFYLGEPKIWHSTSGNVRPMRSMSQSQSHHGHVFDEVPNSALTGLWGAWRHDASNSSMSTVGTTTSSLHTTHHHDTAMTDQTNGNTDSNSASASGSSHQGGAVASTTTGDAAASS